MDVLVVDSEGAPLLLHNQCPNAGHWLEVKLKGTKSNRDGIGALVTFEAGGRKLLRLCHTDGSYMSASDRRVHCGLGGATQATITVKWPSGHTDVFKDQKADQIITLEEGR
jgi:enediyne biosynthesis protein E4